MVDLTQKTIGRYKIVELLGTGGMAVVYKAWDTRLERDVALKIIRMEMFPPAILHTILQRFEREARALARISHPNIVNIFDYGEYESAPFLVMEYLAGGTLKDRLGSPVPYQQAALYLAPVAQALAFAHSENIIHRDVKPGNILFTRRGTPKLSDFGIAKLFDVQESVALTGTSMALGTPVYMAPEQWSGKSSPVSDVYALGVVFYELLTGKPPYQSDTPAGLFTQILTHPLPEARTVVPDLPQKVNDTLRIALAKLPEDRLGSMSEFAHILEGFITRPEIQQPPRQDDLPTLVVPPLVTSSSTTQVVEPADQASLDQVTKTSLPPEEGTLAVPGKLIPKTIRSTPIKLPVFRRNLVLISSLALLFFVFILVMIYIGGKYIGGNRGIPTRDVQTGVPPSAQSVGAIPLTHTSPPELTSTQAESTTASTSTPQPSATTMPTITPTTPLELGATQVSPLDDMVQIFIPAGEFKMGAVSFDGRAQEDEKPQHVVALDAFWIDQHEVTNQMFASCVETNACQELINYNDIPVDFLANPDQAATYVTWENARSYCEWAGRRLPTEAEWEKAARGGLEDSLYPWGNEDPACDFTALNGANSKCYYRISESVEIMRFKPNAYGLYDMAGNAWEWVSSIYKPYPYDPLDGREDLSASDVRVMRGGSVYLGGDDDSRLSNRYYHFQDNFDFAGVPAFSVGFRCAASP